MNRRELLTFSRAACAPCRDIGLEGRIFICYRAEDRAVSTAIYHHLVERFGRDDVFMDIQLRPGEHWLDRGREEIEACQAVIVVMGPAWMDLRDERGRRCLDDPEDPVRTEIQIALELHGDVRIIPVLVEGGAMPDWGRLPDSIQRLKFRVVHELPPQRFGPGFEAAMTELGARLTNLPDPRRLKWDEITQVSAPLLVANALLRPMWATILLPLALVVAALTIPGATWLLAVAVVTWLALGAVTLFDPKYFRCVERWLLKSRGEGVAQPSSDTPAA